MDRHICPKHPAVALSLHILGLVWHWQPGSMDLVSWFDFQDLVQRQHLQKDLKGRFQSNERLRHLDPKKLKISVIGCTWWKLISLLYWIWVDTGYADGISWWMTPPPRNTRYSRTRCTDIQISITLYRYTVIQIYRYTRTLYNLLIQSRYWRRRVSAGSQLFSRKDFMLNGI